MMNHGSVLGQFIVALAKYIQFCGMKILLQFFFLGFKQLNVIFLCIFIVDLYLPILLLYLYS